VLITLNKTKNYSIHFHRDPYDWLYPQRRGATTITLCSISFETVSSSSFPMEERYNKVNKVVLTRSLARRLPWHPELEDWSRRLSGIRPVVCGPHQPKTCGHEASGLQPPCRAGGLASVAILGSGCDTRHRRVWCSTDNKRIFCRVIEVKHGNRCSLQR